MADGGASELVMLVTGLIAAGMVASLLMSSWGGLAHSVDVAKLEVEVDSKTDADLISDPMLVSWNQSSCNLSLYVQNIGEISLDEDAIGVIINGTAATVNQTRILDNMTTWDEGEVVELNACPSGLNLVSGQEIYVTIIVQSILYNNVVGHNSFTEVIRLV
ncbi:MAG: hypothetical protein QF479_05065 [Candidatus Poseidoniaceae archaeon]|jgi:archaellum component FlaG (FlaF/FlaG flagellin family)|nr:hypothetical protein [Candidatus Poseidoniaceae archaeon]HJM87709.1 hypothetical protein [Candidatus Thalassarchaeaceae archaeon]